MANERITIEKLQEYHGLIAQDANILKRSTAYILNQVVNKGKIYLQCTQAGTTALTALDLSNVDLDDELTDGTAKWKVVSITGAGFGNSTGAGLEDWESNHDYAVDDIYVYEGEIYKTLIAFTSGATEDERIEINDIVPSVWEENTAYTAGQIIEHTDVTTLNKVYYNVIANFTSGATFEVTAEMQELQIVEEYVPNPLTKQQVKNLINNFVPSGSGTDPIFYNDSPIGTIIAYMGITAPKDYLACDGQTYNIVDYKELAEYIKRQFGAYDFFGGDGTTTFAVPDLRGEFLRGTGTNSHANQGSGANVGVHQDATAERMIFTSTIGTAKIGVMGDSTSEVDTGNYDSSYKTGSGEPKWFTITANKEDTGSTVDIITSRPTNTSVLYCIKYNTSVLSTPENNYSTEEQRIGTWIDGKPLYQKTYNTNIIIDGGTHNIAELPNDCDIVSEIGGVFKFTGGLGETGFVSLNCVYRAADYACFVDAWDGYLRNNSPSASDGWLGTWPCYITIKYTKTTD